MLEVIQTMTWPVAAGPQAAQNKSGVTDVDKKAYEDLIWMGGEAPEG
ncbi:uncharacterized protein N7496_010731 [Penicillium cataractarum]|uniref:Uncharacterized protein n=1 Tax=Penicillium cataractarum TaxID=2100454 RepID=A0A9W9RIS5_9EURO|nr:uncharacterized protein N7496_010731 [Penicillium cataractarum]KAJ5358318.1 hypothetical protein N7496_010731 [Penicillium cataractarum]